MHYNSDSITDTLMHQIKGEDIMTTGLTDMKRVMLYITPEIEASAKALKENEFYDKPYSEIYRHLLSLGVQSANLTNTYHTKEVM